MSGIVQRNRRSYTLTTVGFIPWYGEVLRKGQMDNDAVKVLWRPVQPLIMLEGYFYSASSFLKSYDQVLLCEGELDTFGWFFCSV